MALAAAGVEEKSRKTKPGPKRPARPRHLAGSSSLSTRFIVQQILFLENLDSGKRDVKKRKPLPIQRRLVGSWHFSLHSFSIHFLHFRHFFFSMISASLTNRLLFDHCQYSMSKLSITRWSSISYVRMAILPKGVSTIYISKSVFPDLLFGSDFSFKIPSFSWRWTR